MLDEAVSRIVVTGFLGAGKSRIAQRLGGDMPIDDGDGISVPVGGPGTRIVAVVDGANVEACLSDPLMGAIIRAQIAAADVIVLSRGDVVDIRPVQRLIEPLTSQPILDAHRDAIAAEVIAGLPAGTSAAAASFADQFVEWGYRGPAILTQAAAEQLLADRPEGAWRIAGVVRVPDGGMDLQVFGRGRQVTKVDAPEETVLRAIGPRQTFREKGMDLAFSEAVMTSAYDQGVIACR
ncbi:MAG: hypothetical protein AAF439_13510 [Pseudomonadota bacterium]